jgi:hypothetical protein
MVGVSLRLTARSTSQKFRARALRIYLFRDEYIFELERAVVVETPQLGNATYLFTKPQSMDTFLAAYTRVSKDDIRRNRANIGEKLGFLGRSFTAAIRGAGRKS